MIYLDHNATSPYSVSVKNFIKNEMIDAWANPSSEHAEGGKLANEIKLIRSEIADALDCSSKSLIFNSGATESINTVLSEDNLSSFGVKRIISSAMEHHATLDRLKYLESKGWEVAYVENDREGRINRDHLKNLLQDPRKALLTILYANNETGVINPIKEFANDVHSAEHLIHVDAVQALGKIKLSLSDLDADFASFSGHKIGALKGIGCLYVSDIKSFKPILHGGGQERGYRPGTLNYSAIKSFMLALKDVMTIDLERMHEIRVKLEKELKGIGIDINCESSERLPNTTSIMIPNHVGREILYQLSRKNIYVSTGSACSSGSFEPSHVLKSLGLSKDEANSCLRISFGFNPVYEEMHELITSLTEIVKS